MKILHIIPSLRAGGAERLTLDICRELRRLNHDVKLVFFDNKNEYEYLSQAVNPVFLPVHIRPSLFGKWTIETEALNELIKVFKPDVIHSHLFEAEILSRENIFKGIKYFTHCHDNMSQFKNFSFRTLSDKRRLTDFYEKRHLIKKYLECNNKFIAISRDTKQYFEENLAGKLRQNIFLLNNAVDFNRFHAAYHVRQPRRMNLINAGSFVTKKNQQFLVDVVNELVKNKLDVRLVLLGDGPLLKDVKQKISEYGLQDMITCKGNVTDVERYFSEADIYVHSATYEPFGLVILEAMAAGLPVVALDGKGNRDILKNSHNGFLIPAPDAKVFSEKISLLYKQGDLYEKFVTEGLNTARQYDIGRYVSNLLALYQA